MAERSGLAEHRADHDKTQAIFEWRERGRHATGAVVYALAVQDPRTAYDRWHSAHRTGAGPWYRLVAACLHGSHLLAGARVLEIGCGSGDFAAWMAENGAHEVIGRDFSSVPIIEASERFERDNLTFSLGDVENLDDRAASFDLVVSCETIEHVPSPPKAMSELSRVLRSGGVLLLTTPNYMSITGLHRVFREATGRKWDEGGQPIAHWTALPRTLRWIGRSGLTIRQVQGDGWYVPIPRRPGGYAWEPPAPCRRALVPFALHQLIQAQKP